MVLTMLLKSFFSELNIIFPSHNEDRMSILLKWRIHGAMKRKAICTRQYSLKTHSPFHKKAHFVSIQSYTSDLSKQACKLLKALALIYRQSLKLMLPFLIYKLHAKQAYNVMALKSFICLAAIWNASFHWSLKMAECLLAHLMSYFCKQCHLLATYTAQNALTVKEKKLAPL